MAQVTVEQLAKTVGASVDRLLSQMKDAGLPHSDAAESVSEEDKQTLLAFLKKSHGESTAAPKKITLKRKSLSTLRTGGSGKRTVNVEVRKKRTYVKRDEVEETKEEAAPVEETPIVEEMAEAAPVETPEVVEEAPEVEVEEPAAAEVDAPAEPEVVVEPEPEPEPEVEEEDPRDLDPEVLRQRAAARRKAEEAKRQQALDGQIHRADRIRERTLEQIRRGTILIDTDAATAGQVNGLVVSTLGGFSFGRPIRITARTRRDVVSLIGDGAFLRKLQPREFTDERFGLPTVQDILSELEKPGRDPRPEFKTATFKEGVEKMQDLEPDMVLEGVVTNVTNFGAFVDIGVHQDGLVHVSALSNTFVKDPHDVVAPGDIVKVKVLDVDLARKRIGLTMRLDDRHDDRPAERTEKAGKSRNGRGKGGPRQQRGKRNESKPQEGTMAALFAKAQEEARKKGRL